MNVDGHEHRIGPDDVQLVLQPLDGYQVERSGTHAVALDLELDDELRRETLAREIVHAVQAARKGAGLRVEDRIALTLGRRRRAARGGSRTRGLRDPRDARGRARLRRRAAPAPAPRSRGWSWWWASSGGRLAAAVHLPPAFEERPFVLQLVGLVVVPVIFGLLTGFALGWSEVVYLIMVGPIALLGGFLGGIEHRGGEDGFVRGLAGGLVYGSFILLGHKIAGTEAKAELSDPQVGLVILTTVVGGDARRARRPLPRPPRGRGARGRVADAGPTTRAGCSSGRPGDRSLRGRSSADLALWRRAAASAGVRRGTSISSYDIDSPPARCRRSTCSTSTRRRSRSAARVPWWSTCTAAAGSRATSATRSVRKAGLFTGAGYVFASVNYRLSRSGAAHRSRSTPAASRFPDHPHDVGEAIGWLHRNVARYGGDPTRIVLIGHSSGAHLASLVGVDPRYVRAYGVPQQPDPRGGVARHGGLRHRRADRSPAERGRARRSGASFGTPEENAATRILGCGLAAALGGGRATRRSCS